MATPGQDSAKFRLRREVSTVVGHHNHAGTDDCVEGYGRKRAKGCRWTSPVEAQKRLAPRPQPDLLGRVTHQAAGDELDPHLLQKTTNFMAGRVITESGHQRDGGSVGGGQGGGKTGATRTGG
jgi:hypothetical protein